MIVPILEILSPLIGRWFDKESDRQKFTAEISKILIENDAELKKAQRDIIVAEVQGESWLQRNWRPILMLSIVGIVVNNYIIFPYAQLFGVAAVTLDLPDELFSLMSIGVGGYVVGRSGEKMMKAYKEN